MPATVATAATRPDDLLLGDSWHSRIEAQVRDGVRELIEGLLQAELDAALGRQRYRRLKSSPQATPVSVESAAGLGKDGDAAVPHPAKGHRNGTRARTIMGTFGAVAIDVPRARLDTDEPGKTREWQNKTIPRYQRRTKEVDALIAGAYLSGTNTRRVGRALAALFKGAISKSVVSRVWRKIKADWDNWNKRDLASEDVVRLILDGTNVRVRMDKKSTSISLLVALGVRRDGQKVLLAVRNMGGESEAAWRQVLDDLSKRGLKKPELAIVDGAPGLEKALVSLWGEQLPIQRCTVHKLRNLIAHAPKKFADEIAADYADMIYAEDAATVAKKRKAFLNKWYVKCEAVAASLEEAGDRLFTFTRLPVEQWKSARTTNAIERLHEEFKRRIKTQTVLPSAETAAMLFWALLASGQITLRKIDGWKTIAEPFAEPIDLAA
ncbi:MAG: IS256 family transposase [Gammaproteobacteria bacterium]|nr:IS256 family transposase [Gammaproteobacteria bacterium]